MHLSWNTFECNFVFAGTCTLILGSRFGFLQDTNTDVVGQKLADAIRGQFRASQDAFYGLPLWKFFNTTAYKEFIHCEDTIYEYEKPANNFSDSLSLFKLIHYQPTGLVSRAKLRNIFYFPIFSIISALVEEAIQQDEDACPVDNVHKIFRSILDAKELDIRDKKAAIIDFIAAGIKTVRRISH